MQNQYTVACGCSLFRIFFSLRKRKDLRLKGVSRQLISSCSFFLRLGSHGKPYHVKMKILPRSVILSPRQQNSLKYWLSYIRLQYKRTVWVLLAYCEVILCYCASIRRSCYFLYPCLLGAHWRNPNFTAFNMLRSFVYFYKLTLKAHSKGNDNKSAFCDYLEGNSSLVVSLICSDNGKRVKDFSHHVSRMLKLYYSTRNFHK